MKSLSSLANMVGRKTEASPVKEEVGSPGTFEFDQNADAETIPHTKESSDFSK